MGIHENSGVKGSNPEKRLDVRGKKSQLVEGQSAGKGNLTTVGAGSAGKRGKAQLPPKGVRESQGKEKARTRHQKRSVNDSKSWMLSRRGGAVTFPQNSSLQGKALFSEKDLKAVKRPPTYLGEADQNKETASVHNDAYRLHAGRKEKKSSSTKNRQLSTKTVDRWGKGSLSRRGNVMGGSPRKWRAAGPSPGNALADSKKTPPKGREGES